MGHRMHIQPRRSPRQARARFTVDAIVEGSLQVLLDRGYDRFTTTRAAERAGVSVGSLYQYFPNKAALAAAVVDRCCERFLEAVEQALAGGRHATLADCIRALVDVTIRSHHLTPERHQCVQGLVPRVGATEKTTAVSRKVTLLIESALRRHAGAIAPDVDLALAAVMIETTLEALAHRAVAAYPEPGGNDALAREATRLILHYLAAG